jgi:polyisoprenoid-binding protein YceI
MLRAASRLIIAHLLLSSMCVGAATQWQLDREQSSITFKFSQEGVSFTGSFERFELQLQFSAKELETSYFVAEIDLGSLNTHSKDRDLILRSADFFNVKRWPVAEFSTDSIEHIGDNRYVARARLRIRDASRQVDFPFTADISGQQQPVFSGSGELIIDRADYGLARGDWADDLIVGPAVSIMVNIRAVP